MFEGCFLDDIATGVVVLTVRGKHRNAKEHCKNSPAQLCQDGYATPAARPAHPRLIVWSAALRYQYAAQPIILWNAFAVFVHLSER